MLKKRYTSAQDLDGVIDLERLRSGSSTSLERDAAGFLDLTWPSTDVHALVRGLSNRFNGGSQSGTFLAHSAKGLGKSHALLLGYHLFSNPEIARAWMEHLGYDWAPPDDTLVIVRKLTDHALPDDALWLLVAEHLGADWPGERPPNLEALRAALGNRHVVLVLDELERGIVSIRDPARQNQNLAFLQMLSEEANRDRRITLFAAVYDGNREPGATLKRTPPNRIAIPRRRRPRRHRSASPVLQREHLRPRCGPHRRPLVREHVAQVRRRERRILTSNEWSMPIRFSPISSSWSSSASPRAAAFKARAAPWGCSAPCWMP